MRKIIAAITVFVFLSSCKFTSFDQNYRPVNQTQVILQDANFKVLGSFSGISTAKKMQMSIKEQRGLVAEAKANFLSNAKAEGVILTGSRALVNVSVDVIKNKKHVTATYSGEIIEFINN